MLDVSFSVRRAGVEHEPAFEGDAFSVGIDDGTPNGRSVLFMTTEGEEFSEGLASENYCIATDNGRSSYGGVVRLRLTRASLEIGIDEDSVEELDVASGNWVLPLDLSDSDFDALRSGLRRVFADAPSDINGGL